MLQHRLARPSTLFTPQQWSTYSKLIGGLLASCSLFFWAYHQEQSREQAMFERRAQLRSAMVQRGISDATEALQVLNQLFVTNGEVSSAQFHAFSQPLRQRFPYIELFSYRRLLSQAERPAYEARMQRKYPGFSISDIVDGKRQPAAIRPHYRVIEDVEPLAPNALVLGMDILAQPLQSVFLQADETGLPIASPLFHFYKDQGKQRGFRILMALYQPGAPLTDRAARRRAVIGYTGALLRAGDLIENILAPTSKLSNAGLHIGVYAAASAEAGQLVYSVGAQPPRRWFQASELSSFTDNFEAAGMAWHVVINAQPTPLLTTHTSSFLALLAGLLSTVACGAYLRSIARRTRRVERLVAQRTDEIKQVNRLLLEDIEARKVAEEALRHSRSALRKLAAHQESVKEDERKRIARDIHDDLGQNLLVLRLDLSRLALRADSARNAKKRGEEALQQIDTTIKAVRAIINDLRPSVLDLGLHAAVEWQAQRFERYSNIRCELQLDEDEPAIDDQRATALFRILQEALSNIMRHAQASQVRITLQQTQGKLHMEIADNGIGMGPDADTKADAFGLVGMAERVHALKGSFSTASPHGVGLTIMLSIPLVAPEASQPRRPARLAAG